jgi:protein-disulfide isomerase
MTGDPVARDRQGAPISSTGAPMASETARPGRRQRRAETLATRRADRQRRTAKPPTRIGLGTISVIAIMAGLAIVGFLALTRPSASSGLGPVVRAAAPAGVTSDGETLGAASAPVTVDVYEDFQCPVCLGWSQNVFPALARNELASGRARLVFHGYQFIGPESVDAGRAAWAAGQQGRFWDMWATLYANQGVRENGGAFSRDRLLAMANAIGLDPTRFQSDFASAAATRAVSDGVSAAEQAGVNATPTVLVNGRPASGLAYPVLAAAIASAAP